MAWKNNGETELCRIKCVPCVFKCNGWTARQLTIREHATGLNHSPTLLWPWMPLSHNAVILPQGRKPGERNKKNVSEKAVHAGAEPRVNFKGRTNSSACHRGAWDMWPACLCKQRLAALACLLHLSIGVLDSLFTLFQCWKSLVTADTWNRNSLTQRLRPQHWRICAINKSENLSPHNGTNWSCTHLIFTHSNYGSNLRGAQTLKQSSCTAQQGKLGTHNESAVDRSCVSEFEPSDPCTGFCFSFLHIHQHGQQHKAGCITIRYHSLIIYIYNSIMSTSANFKHLFKELFKYYLHVRL